MKDFRPSLACFLIVLGQLCLNCELNFNLTVDFSLELSAVLTLVGVVALTILRILISRERDSYVREQFS